MPRDALRRNVWLGLGLIALLVLLGWAFVLTARHGQQTRPAPEYSSAEDELDVSRAMRLPEYKELTSNYPLRPKGMTREKGARLIELTRHSSPALRGLAVRQLGFVEDDSRKEALVILSDRLQDPHFFVRISAMDALAILGAKEQIPAILPFLNSPDFNERACAKRALARLGHLVD
jgi:hypothetical protein